MKLSTIINALEAPCKRRLRRRVVKGDPLSALEVAIGYKFRDRKHLETALTHPSLVLHAPDLTTYQRLEFLGDAVLGLALAEALYHAFPGESEGFLARTRSTLASGRYLSDLSQRLGLHEHLRMADGEREAGHHKRASVLEDALEAVIGAIYLDSNQPMAASVVIAWYQAFAQSADGVVATENPKGALQEHLQAGEGVPGIDYAVVAEDGPAHARRFTVELRVNGEPRGRGHGRTKKDAEEAAALQALTALKSPKPLQAQGTRGAAKASEAPKNRQSPEGLRGTGGSAVRGSRRHRAAGK